MAKYTFKRSKEEYPNDAACLEETLLRIDRLRGAMPFHGYRHR
jgi:hypothetical protein